MVTVIRELLRRARQIIGPRAAAALLLAPVGSAVALWLAPAGSSSTSRTATRLALGDGKVSTTRAKRGYVFSCRSADPNAPGAQVVGPWIDEDDGTWSPAEKISVDGEVTWRSAKVSFTASGSRLRITGNDLPTLGTTGVFPVSPSDEAYAYDRNPNSIERQTISWTLPASPKRASSPTCLPMGPIGIATNGVLIFNALDAAGRDAVAHEVQDSNHGHPERSGSYHYHDIPPLLTREESSKQHSGVVGYALDGFPITGKRGDGGRVLTNSDLDACHGHTGTITLRGKRVRTYHYHATAAYPYTVGCFRGTPVSARR